MSQVENVGPHGMLEPFEPKPRVLPQEVLELLTWVANRDIDTSRGQRWVAHSLETRRRAEVVIAMHYLALDIEKAARS
ncbi:MAG TPA: hypothetical protein VK745_15080 [Polyangiaceae bacterium]|nr:hypothetical protein [Polyangiaceae bacterium]